MLTRYPTVEETRQGFRWDIPEFYNIGLDVSDRPAMLTPNTPAIIDVAQDGSAQATSFAQLRDLSNQVAGMFAARLSPGDRIAVLLPQCLETALGHIGAFKMGAISIPLFTLFGPEALLHRLRDSGAKAIVTDAAGADRLAPLRPELPTLEHIYVIDTPTDDVLDFQREYSAQPVGFSAAKTRAEDPALLIYTSGTTGNPKGALHAHRVLIGHLPGVEMSHDFFPQPKDRIWTPADWAWIGGLLDVLLPALHHGVAVVAHRFAKFDAQAAFALIRRHKVRNAFLPPTALKMMREAAPSLHPPLALRSVASGGETLGASLIDWGQRVLGTTINEFYGQTECNMIVSSCGALEPAEPGVTGFAVPGHRVAVIDAATGAQLPGGETGEIAVQAPDPVMFLRYWNQPEATEAKFVDGPDGRWLLTGDKGFVTPTGRIKYVGRDDDVISSAGYRIGPGEIEDCLTGHPAVRLAGVVGRPDALRGSAIIAFVSLTEGYAPSDALADEIAGHVKTSLAAHEYPREVRFTQEMPMTTTGKIIRATLRDWARELS
jgi:acetyl-CoA synthetase